MLMNLCNELIEVKLLDHIEMQKRFDSESALRGKNMYVDRSLMQDMIQEDRSMCTEKNHYVLNFKDVMEKFYKDLLKKND